MLCYMLHLLTRKNSEFQAFSLDFNSDRIGTSAHCERDEGDGDHGVFFAGVGGWPGSGGARTSPEERSRLARAARGGAAAWVARVERRARAARVEERWARARTSRARRNRAASRRRSGHGVARVTAASRTCLFSRMEIDLGQGRRQRLYTAGSFSPGWWLQPGLKTL